MSHVVVIGDALLDRDLDGVAGRLAPDAPVPVVDDLTEHPRPGGAGLAALLTGVSTTLVCALGDDDAGRLVRALLERAGVEVIDLGLRGATPEKTRVRAGGRALVLETDVTEQLRLGTYRTAPLGAGATTSLRAVITAKATAVRSSVVTSTVTVTSQGRTAAVDVVKVAASRV